MPCTPCAPGTVAPGFGATSCQPCPDGTAATGSDAFVCADCDCDDATACTLDTCNAATAVCSAEAVPSCELVHVEFSGVVDRVFDFSLVAVGMPIAGSYDVDPLAPDETPLDPSAGSYATAARSFEIRVGDPAVVTAVGSLGSVGVFDAFPNDVYRLDFDEIAAAVDDVETASFALILTAKNAFAGDALIEAPSLASFDSIRLTLALSFEEADSVIESSDFALTAPEPDAVALAGAATAVLLALTSSRRRT